MQRMARVYVLVASHQNAEKKLYQDKKQSKATRFERYEGRNRKTKAEMREGGELV